MAYDKQKFREEAQKRAVQARVQKVRTRMKEEAPTTGADPEVKEDEISLEEKRVIEQYRQWKATRESSKPADDKAARVARIKEKIAKKLVEEDLGVNPKGDAAETGDPASAVDGNYGGKVAAQSPGPNTPKQPTAGGSGGGSGEGTNAAGSEVKQVTNQGAKKTLEKTERAEKIRRKLEKKARIEKIKARIAEKREAAGDQTSSKKIKEDAAALKERIAKLRTKLSENEMMAAPAAPAGQPIGGDPASAMMGTDPMADPMAAGTELPPEIIAEIQSISTAAQNLASLAGITPEPELGADVEAGIPAEMGTEGLDDPMAAQQPVLESKNKKGNKILEAIKSRKGDDMGTENIVESTRDRVAARRAKLAELRAKTMNESYEEIGDPTAQAKEVVDGTLGPIPPKENQLHNAGAKRGPLNQGPTKGNAKLKPAKTWPTKPVKGKKFEGDETEAPEGQEQMEESWDEKHISHYIERKELSFKDMISRGLLG